MYHNFFIHSSVDGHLGHFHVLAIVNSAAMNNGIHVSFSILVSSRYMPTSGIAGSYGSSIPRFLRNLHLLLYSGCSSLQSHKQCKRVPFSPYHLSRFHIYALVYDIYLSVSDLTSLCIIGSRLNHLIRTDSNAFRFIAE